MQIIILDSVETFIETLQNREIAKVIHSIELLEGSIKSIRNVVDYITVIYQDISNLGNPAQINIKELLVDLKEKGLINSFYLYKPQLNAPIPHINEINKRNMGLYVCQGEGCTHYMSMDTAGNLAIPW